MQTIVAKSNDGHVFLMVATEQRLVSAFEVLAAKQSANRESKDVTRRVPTHIGARVRAVVAENRG